MSENCVVPEAEAFVVEYPGYVRNVQAMMQTLGGSKALAAAANGSNSVLQLRFRPDDLISHPLYGERQATNGLLLKLSRPDAGPEDPRVSAEVVARVHSKFTFTGMADYQYLPVDPSVSASASCSSTGPYGDEVQPLLCIPPLFTKSDVPLDYAFKQFKAPDKPGEDRHSSDMLCTSLFGLMCLTKNMLYAVNRPKPSPQWLVPYTVQQVPSNRASEATMQGNPCAC